MSVFLGRTKQLIRGCDKKVAGFVKLYGTILTSSVWVESTSTRIVWITLLALADKNGFVSAAVPGLAHTANVSLADCEAALRVLEAPDTHSRTPDNDGRRVERVDGGWVVLNRTKYRDLQTEKQIADADRQRKFRGTTEGYVYYILHDERIKIGYSRNPWARCHELRCSIPSLEIWAVESGPKQLEKDRHAQFGHLRLEGEWFRASPELREFIDPIARSHRRNATTTDVAPEGREQSTENNKTKSTPFVYPPDFELLWNALPKKPGANKRQTYRLYTGHLRAGIDFDTMHQGALRYAAYALAKGWIGTDYVKAPQVFMGRDQHFLSSWDDADLPKKLVAVGGEPTADELRSLGIRL